MSQGEMSRGEMSHGEKRRMGRNVAGRNVAGRNVAGRNVFWGETSHSPKLYVPHVPNHFLINMESLVWILHSES